MRSNGIYGNGTVYETGGCCGPKKMDGWLPYLRYITQEYLKEKAHNFRSRLDQNNHNHRTQSKSCDRYACSKRTTSRTTTAKQPLSQPQSLLYRTSLFTSLPSIETWKNKSGTLTSGVSFTVKAAWIGLWSLVTICGGGARQQHTRTSRTNRNVHDSSSRCESKSGDATHFPFMDATSKGGETRS